MKFCIYISVTPAPSVLFETCPCCFNPEQKRNTRCGWQGGGVHGHGRRDRRVVTFKFKSLILLSNEAPAAATWRGAVSSPLLLNVFYQDTLGLKIHAVTVKCCDFVVAAAAGATAAAAGLTCVLSPPPPCGLLRFDFLSLFGFPIVVNSNRAATIVIYTYIYTTT